MSRRIKNKKTKAAGEIVTTDIPDYDKNMYDHLKPKNIAAKKQSSSQIGQNTGLTKVKGFLIVVVVIVALAFTGAFTSDFGGSNNKTDGDQIINTNNGGQGIITPLKDVWLEGHTDIGDHYHLFISFIIFGKTQGLSTDVGVYGSRMKPIHTHDASGKVHIELPSDYTLTPTLKDLFAIWSEWAGETIELSKTRLIGESGSVSLNSNGQFVLIDDPNSYQLVQHSNQDEILEIFID